MNISDKLKDLRIKNNKTQKEIAAALGVSVSTIGMYETGKRIPNPNVVGKLATMYNVSSDYLIGLTTEGTSTPPKRPKELIKLIEQEEYTLNGQIATQEDREKLAKIIEALYWDAKEKNKRK